MRPSPEPSVVVAPTPAPTKKTVEPPFKSGKKKGSKSGKKGKRSKKGKKKKKKKGKGKSSSSSSSSDEDYEYYDDDDDYDSSDDERGIFTHDNEESSTYSYKKNSPNNRQFEVDAEASAGEETPEGRRRRLMDGASYARHLQRRHQAVLRPVP